MKTNDKKPKERLFISWKDIRIRTLPIGFRCGIWNKKKQRGELNRKAIKEYS
jgi:hypothetical protein